MQDGDLLNPGLLQVDAQAIKALYLEKGFTDASVSSEFRIDEETDQATITFSIG